MQNTDGLPAPTISSERKKLSRPRKLGSATGWENGIRLLLGTPFVAVGVGNVLMLLGWLQVDDPPRGNKAIMLSFFGLLFGLAGLYIWASAILGLRKQAYRSRARRMHPNEPALHDHAWDPRGARCTHWKPFWRSLLVAGFLTFFLSPFNYIVFFQPSGTLPKVVVGLLDGLLILVWAYSFYLLVRVLIYGPSRVTFHQFPYRLGEPLRLSWAPGGRLDNATEATAELRCLNEYWIRVGTDENSSRKLVHQQLWSETYHLPPSALPRRHGSLELEFHPPANGASTHLATETPYAWMLIFRVKRPGIDLYEEYLMPVYGDPAEGFPPESWLA